MHAAFNGPFHDVEDYEGKVLLLRAMAVPDHERTPDIDAFLRRPSVRFIFRHIQDFIWTCRRWLSGNVRYTFDGGLQKMMGQLPVANGVSETSRGSVAKENVQSDGANVAFPGGKIYIDITSTLNARDVGGIARVALKMAEAGLRSGRAVPVTFDGNALRLASDERSTITLRPGDRYLLIDIFWTITPEHRDFCKKARQSGAMAFICIHDIFPLHYPILMEPGFYRDFSTNLGPALASFDAILTVSKYVAADVRQIIGSRYPENSGTPIEVFRLGDDAIAGTGGAVRDQIKAVFSNGPTMLGVGAVVPHKGVPVALSGFDVLWSEGADVQYTLFGRTYSSCPWLRELIEKHPQYGRRLYWFEDASDSELAYGFARSKALVMPSVIEGFGLPLVEALRSGLPVVASDLAVFREIAGNMPLYFPPCNTAGLVRALRKALKAERISVMPNATSWDDAFRSLTEAMARCAE